MKKCTFLLGLLAFVMSAVTAQTDYTQFLVVTLKPRPDKIAAFEAAMGAHNKKYHTADPYKAYVWAISTGPKSGSYYYVMGPMTFTQMDARTTTPEHDTDWNNVVANCESVGDASYWRWEKDITYTPEGASNFPKSRMRYSSILPGQGDRYEEQIKKVAEVYKQKKYQAGFNVYWRYGASQGPHAVTSLDFDKWAYFDNPNTWVEDFESVHGEGSWMRFQEELDLCVDRSKTFDELIEFMPAMSSN